MIRLNDIDKTVIDESKVVAYYGYGEDKICIYLGGSIYVDYNSKELRDKDIELLDKLLDVKSIEDKANEEYDFGELQVIDPKPAKEEKYITWHYIMNFKCDTKFKVELSNGDVRKIYYDDCLNAICIENLDDSNRNDAIIFKPDLFNALMLKKVE